MSEALEDYSYCKIFVNAAGEETAALVRNVLGQDFDEFGYMSVSAVNVEVRCNKDADGPAAQRWRAAHQGAVDFVNFVLWPTLVELEADEVEGTHVIVGLTERILTALWNAEYPAVAACDFEDELPWSGGVQRIRLR